MLGGPGAVPRAPTDFPAPQKPPPINPFPPGDPRHQKLDDVNWKLLAYETNLAAYTRKLALEPGNPELLVEYTQLMNDLADIKADYAALGITLTISPPGMPGSDSVPHG
jgi:hypothetical protein